MSEENKTDEGAPSVVEEDETDKASEPSVSDENEDEKPASGRNDEPPAPSV